MTVYQIEYYDPETDTWEFVATLESLTTFKSHVERLTHIRPNNKHRVVVIHRTIEDL